MCGVAYSCSYVLLVEQAGVLTQSEAKLLAVQWEPTFGNTQKTAARWSLVTRQDATRQGWWNQKRSNSPQPFSPNARVNMKLWTTSYCSGAHLAFDLCKYQHKSAATKVHFISRSSKVWQSPQLNQVQNLISKIVGVHKNCSSTITSSEILCTFQQLTFTAAKILGEPSGNVHCIQSQGTDWTQASITPNTTPNHVLSTLHSEGKKSKHSSW